MIKVFTKNKNSVLVTGLTLLSLVLGFIFLGTKDFSMDEVATALVVQNWSGMLHIFKTVEDNMWLYYFTLHFWQVFGSNEFALRSLTALLGAASIPFIYLLGRKLFNSYVGLVTALLISINVFLVSNQQNARSYALVPLFTTISSLFFTKYVLSYVKTRKEQKKYLYLTILFNILGLYTHFYTVFVIGSQVAALLLTREKKIIKNFLLSLPVYGLVLIPQLLQPSFRNQPTYWIPVPTIRNLIGTFIILSDDLPAIAGLYIVLFSCFFVTLWKKRKKIKAFDSQYWNIHFLFIWLLLPIIFSFVFSLLVRPMYLSMYFVICLVPFTLLVAFIISHIQKTWLKRLLISVLILLSAIRLFGWYTGNQNLQLVISNNNEDWRGAANFLVQDTKPDQAVLFFPVFVQQNVEYYWQTNHQTFDKNRLIMLQPDTYSGAAQEKIYDHKKLEDLPKNYKSIWYVYGTYTDRNIAQEDHEISQVLKTNYTLTRVVYFYNITAYQYIRK